MHNKATKWKSQCQSQQNKPQRFFPTRTVLQWRQSKNCRNLWNDCQSGDVHESMEAEARPKLRTAVETMESSTPTARWNSVQDARDERGCDPEGGQAGTVPSGTNGSQLSCGQTHCRGHGITSSLSAGNHGRSPDGKGYLRRAPNSPDLWRFRAACVATARTADRHCWLRIARAG